MKSAGTKKITDYEEFNGREVAYYSTDEFNKKYKNLFSSTPNYVDAEGCPSYYYNKNGKYYFDITECGYADKTVSHIYIHSMEKNEKVVTVKIYVGATITDENITTSSTVKIYSSTTSGTPVSCKTVDHLS